MCVYLSSWMPWSCHIESHHWFKTYYIKHMNVLLVVLQLTASNMEGKSCPSEVLVCTTSPDRPGPPTRPLIKGPVMSHGFSVKWGMFYCYCYCCFFLTDFFFNLISFSSDKPVNKETILSEGVLHVWNIYIRNILTMPPVDKIDNCKSIPFTSWFSCKTFLLPVF